MQENYKVYLVREISTNNIKYVGLTRTRLIDRFNSHVKRFKLKRYEYTIELIAEDLSVTAAAELERMLIKQYDLLNVGWNKSPGSINGFSNNHSEAQKQKWAEERPGKPVKPDHAEKNRTARLGKKNSESHNKRISELSSRPVMCVETGVIYSSQRKAADAIGGSYPRMADAVNGKRKTIKGLHFVRVQETVEIDRNVRSLSKKKE
jgi:hypothetical protein